MPRYFTRIEVEMTTEQAKKWADEHDVPPGPDGAPRAKGMSDTVREEILGLASARFDATITLK